MKPERIGIDRRDGEYFAARLSDSAGRPEVRALLRLEQKHLGSHRLLTGGQIVLAVPDDQVMVKSLHLKASVPSSVEDRAMFELASTVLDSEDNFQFDLIETGLEDRYVGLIYRQKRLTGLRKEIIPEGQSGKPTANYTMRAMALGRGYTSFCRVEPGELLCLVDIGEQAVSICFLYRRKIVALAGMKFDPSVLATDEGQTHLAIELKTVVNFWQAALAHQSITVPLAKLILSGGLTGNEIPKPLADLFPTGIVRPTMNMAFFGDQAHSPDIPFDNYLIALGLAAG
ncbi:MAG: hypothetical protein V3T31_11460 [candidate division Zixibacteria bacterium]